MLHFQFLTVAEKSAVSDVFEALLVQERKTERVCTQISFIV